MQPNEPAWSCDDSSLAVRCPSAPPELYPQAAKVLLGLLLGMAESDATIGGCVV